MRLRRFSINNAIFFHEYRADSPLYISVIIPNCSLSEPVTERGLSHVYEHFLCRENSLLPDFELLKVAIAKRGIYVNAHTSLDCIKVHMGVPDKVDITWGVKLLFAMLYEPLFELKALKDETNAIQNEMNSLKTNPSRYIYNKLYQKAFNLNEEYIPNFGSESALSKITIKQVKNLHTKLLQRPKLFISSGGIRFTDFKALVNDIPMSPVNNFVFDIPEAKPAVICLNNPNKDITFGMAIPVTIHNIKQACAYDVLAEYLGHHTFGELISQLRHKYSYIYGIEVGFSLYRQTSFFTITMDVSGKKLSATKKVIKKCLTDIIAGGLSSERLEITKSLILKNSIANIERTSGLVIANERLLKFYPDWKHDYADYLEVIQKVELSDILLAAQSIYEHLDGLMDEGA